MIGVMDSNNNNNNNNNGGSSTESEIDLMEEFDISETENLAEDYNNLITEFDNADIVEEVQVVVPSATAVAPRADAVYIESVSDNIPLAETTPLYHYQNPDADDDMLVEAIEIISCEQDQNNYFQDCDFQTGNDSEFVEYVANSNSDKQCMGDVQMLHNKMDSFMVDNNIFGSNDAMEEDDIEVFATMMQNIEEEHQNHVIDCVENKQIMQAMVMSNQSHVEQQNAIQQQEDEIAVQIGPICTAPFQSDNPQFSIGSCETNGDSANCHNKKKNSKKKKEKRPSGFGGCGNGEEGYEVQKNVLRQEATAKRKRTAGKFAKRKIEWMTITDAMKLNAASNGSDPSTTADDSKSETSEASTSENQSKS